MTDHNLSSIEDWISTTRLILNGGGLNQHVDISTTATPRAAFIAAPDFPLDPLVLTGCLPGEIYDIRTVGGLVPPSAGEAIDTAVGAALEFAVKIHRVCHIILITHPNCGLVESLIKENAPEASIVAQGQYLPSWVALASMSLPRVLRADITENDRARLCCHELMRTSFENLMTYQWVLDADFEGELHLHGWYCDLHNGLFERFDAGTDTFISD